MGEALGNALLWALRLEMGVSRWKDGGGQGWNTIRSVVEVEDFWDGGRYKEGIDERDGGVRPSFWCLILEGFWLNLLANMMFPNSEVHEADG